ncbi:hypothetical protein [Aureimonas sp. D3]|uniref:hypothetical protein n=1 Tax=Aureimonas sp. D3 TaxID=1638164 RepID=UPI000782D30C|nr:hypothetical protein [Aureimonas sp. D3]
MAKLQNVRTAIDIARAATLEATQRALVETAKREHAKIMGADPRPGGFRRWVDGREGAAEETVKDFGVIQYEYSRLDTVAQFALETLFDLSPVDSGAYRQSHTLFTNGQAVTNLKAWKPGDTVYISSFLPYSRVIENGSMRMKTPGTDQVYAQASWIVHRRFGNIANVGWTWIGVVNGQTGYNDEFDRSDARYPALMIAEH